MKSLIPLLVLPLVAGCATIADKDWTASGAKSAAAVRSTTPNNGGKGELISGLNRVDYVSGVGSNGAEAYAGFEHDIPVAVLPSSGTALYSGPWEVGGVTDIFVLTSSDFEGTLYGTSFTDGGMITLTSDFDVGTLTGTSGLLSVNGTFAGQTVGGTVTYDGTSGPLAGRIGSSDVIGAFHGNDDSQVFGGGFFASTP